MTYPTLQTAGPQELSKEFCGQIHAEETSPDINEMLFFPIFRMKGWEKEDSTREQPALVPG